MGIRGETGIQQQEQKQRTPDEKNRYPQVSQKFSLLVCCLLVLTMTIFWLLTTYNSRNILRQQADILGQTLANQTAAQVTEVMLENDLISINVMLNSLIDNSTIAEITVTNVNDEIIARTINEASEVSGKFPLSISLAMLITEYTAPISIADSIIGYVTLDLNVSYIEASLVDNLVLIVVATLLLLTVAIAITSLYYKNLISFPVNLLSFYLGKIRDGEVETCPVPRDDNELSSAIRQFNATAEFLAQNTFLKNINVRQPEAVAHKNADTLGLEDTTILLITMSNFQYLASTLTNENLAAMLNKYYFYSGKISQLYNGKVCFCSEDEVLINFSRLEESEEQAFYAVCSAQLFLQLFTEINRKNKEISQSKFRLVIHSGNSLSTLYSPITQKMDNLSGETLDIAKMISKECPSNSILISEPALMNAGYGTRVEATEYGSLNESGSLNYFITHYAMSEYKFLLQKQTAQLLKLFDK